MSFAKTSKQQFSTFNICFYSQTINSMTWNRKDGLRFSFGTNNFHEAPSSRSTPRFPSIQFEEKQGGGSEQKDNRSNVNEKNFEFKRTSSDIYLQLGGGGIELLKKQRKPKVKLIDKIIPFLMPDDTKSIESAENKSVKSGYSLRQRLSNHSVRHDKRLIDFKHKTKSIERHSNSLSNILEMKIEAPLFKRIEDKNNGILNRFKTTEVASNVKVETKKQQSPIQSQRDTLKIANNFFEAKNNTNTEGIGFRQTKKMIQNIQKNKMATTSSNEKNKIFKSFLHKGRPQLKLNRMLTNDKIESISKNCEAMDESY